MMYGTLSTKPEIKIETRRMRTKPKNLFPPVTSARNAANSFKSPISEIAPTTTKIPHRKKIVSQSSSFIRVRTSSPDFFWLKTYQTIPAMPRTITYTPEPYCQSK